MNRPPHPFAISDGGTIFQPTVKISRRALIKSAIVLFCVFHMAEVGLYSIPAEANDALSTLLKKTMPLVRPYILITSQWQQWNLFSPDPLRIVVRYRIDALRGGRWVPATMISPDTVQWWRKANELKLIGYMEPYSAETVKLRARYIAAYCRPLGLPPGTQVRYTFQYYILPIDSKPAAWWRAWNPEWKSENSDPITCPNAGKEGIADILFPPGQ